MTTGYWATKHGRTKVHLVSAGDPLCRTPKRHDWTWMVCGHGPHPDITECKACLRELAQLQSEMRLASPRTPENKA